MQHQRRGLSKRGGPLDIVRAGREGPQGHSRLDPDVSREHGLAAQERDTHEDRTFARRDTMDRGPCSPVPPQLERPRDVQERRHRLGSKRLRSSRRRGALEMDDIADGAVGAEALELVAVDVRRRTMGGKWEWKLDVARQRAPLNDLVSTGTQLDPEPAAVVA